MKTRLNLLSITARFLAAVLLLVAGVTRVFAVNVSEGTDFPNAAPGAPYVLDLCTNTFSGSLNTPDDGQDRFNVTVPTRKLLKQATKFFAPGGSPAVQVPNCSFNGEDLSGTGSGTYVNNYPL